MVFSKVSRGGAQSDIRAPVRTERFHHTTRTYAKKKLLPTYTVSGIRLLSTCHQVHVEATCMLYSRNKFIISGNYYSSMVDQWLTSIGRQRQRVHQLFVNMCGVSPNTSPDIQPIVRQLFLHPLTNPKITFIGLEGQQCPDNEIAASGVNKLLVQLSDRTSQLGICVRLWHPYCSVRCCLDGSEVRFIFHTTAEFRFTMSQDGNLVPQCTRFDIDFYNIFISYPIIKDKVIDLLVGLQFEFRVSKYRAVVDINRGVIPKGFVELLGINRRLRRITLERLGSFVLDAQFTLQNAAVSARHFVALERWVQTLMSSPPRSPRRCHNSRFYALLTIRLRCDNKPSRKSVGLQFSAIPFIWATLPLPGAVILRVQPSYDGVAAADLTTPEVDLHSLRARVLRFLEELVLIPRDRHTRSCSVIWVDEMLRVQTADFMRSGVVTSTVRNKEPEWKFEWKPAEPSDDEEYLKAWWRHKEWYFDKQSREKRSKPWWLQPKQEAAQMQAEKFEERHLIGLVKILRKFMV
jgi:hypothetical protein